MTNFLPLIRIPLVIWYMEEVELYQGMTFPILSELNGTNHITQVRLAGWLPRYTKTVMDQVLTTDQLMCSHLD